VNSRNQIWSAPASTALWIELRVYDARNPKAPLPLHSAGALQVCGAYIVASLFLVNDFISVYSWLLPCDTSVTDFEKAAKQT
jgi:hypothetical protein